MTIIKIEKSENGAHANQTLSGVLRKIPEGFAVVPNPEECENFPFGDFEVDMIEGVPTAVNWVSLPKPPEPKPVDPTPAELRENAYDTEAIISWDGELITVTAAAQLWQYYAAEGNAKADELQALIAAAKAEIRTKYPDEEVTV